MIPVLSENNIRKIEILIAKTSLLTYNEQDNSLNLCIIFLIFTKFKIHYFPLQII